MTDANGASSDGSRRAYRRRWNRVPAEARLAAAATLRDLSEGFSRRTEWMLLVLLAVSLAAHAVLAGLLPMVASDASEDVAAAENSYLQRIMQRDRAKVAAAEASQRITAPPAPPDPEKFVAETFTEELTRDLTQVTAGLLDVKLEQSLTEHVQATLAEELAEASRKITTGKLNSDEIKQLHRDFKTKAIGAAREWREVHREEYQVQIAAKTVTEWYEERVASQIRNIVKTSLFTGRQRLWDWVFGSHDDPPGFLVNQDRHPLYLLHSRVSALKGGRFLAYHFDRKDRPEGFRECKDAGGGWMSLPGWPEKMTPGQAGVVRRLAADYAGGWETAFDRFVEEYHPHEREAMAAAKKELAGLWQRLKEQSEALPEDPRDAAGSKDLTAKAAALSGTLADLDSAMGKLLVDPARQGACQTINRAVRSRVLRGDFRETAYVEMIDQLVAKMRPPIEQLAESQFREGIVLSEEGVHQAMGEFRVKAVVLLRRDMENTISRPFFHRKLFASYYNPYVNEITKESGPPTEAEIAADEAALAKAVGSLPESDRGYVAARAEAVKAEIRRAIARSIDGMLEQVVDDEGRLRREYYAKADTVDYADPFQQKLEARDMAWKGRKQDLADLTAEGVPDTSTPLIALASGAGTGQIALKPVLATMHPGYFERSGTPRQAVRAFSPSAPASGSGWGFLTQAEVEPPFLDTPNFEAIPFLPTFPNLDGDLSDWGTIRPLILRNDNVTDEAYATEPALVYAAWNYQGYFFGYHVDQDPIKFHLPSDYRIGEDGVSLIKDHVDPYSHFTERGDFFVLMLDTLDARQDYRGDPHAQEFYILPMGSATDPDLPGAERVFLSRRHASHRMWGRAYFNGVLFAPQPRSGPDGTGPYRVTRQDDKGYTVEVFLPRSVFKTPVFAPGWYVGFECFIGVGKQPSGSGARYQGKGWANNTSWPASVGNSPSRWGDLLLLGTDARVTIQDARTDWPVSTSVLGGRSYLVTVVDPDRNINLAAPDTALVSAECLGVGGVSDVELYVLKETGKNTSVFQGYVNTQPGFASNAYGTLEVFPGSQVRFGYVDIGDSRGRRNVVHEWKLPVVAPAVIASRAE